MAHRDSVTSRAAGIGAGAGGAAWVIGYLLSYLIESGSIEERLQGFNFVVDLFGGEPIPVWQAVGWLYFNAHGVETNIPVFGETIDRNFIAGNDELSLLYVLPPLLIIGAGLVAAHMSETETPSASGLVGALVLIGYLPMVVLGVVVFGHQIGGGTMAPKAVTAVVLAGLLYPIVFGGLGGILEGVR